MIDVDEAHRVLMANVKVGPVVEVPLQEALFRTLAEPIVSDMDHPPFDRAVMDGYAVRARDVTQTPVSLRVVGQIPAGASPETSLQAGEAMQINTGAPIPAGADAVVRVEHTVKAPDANLVEIRETVAAGKFITARGTYRGAGETALDARTLLTPLEIGVAASVGAARIKVYAKPTVSVLATGNELVGIDQVPEGPQIRNSNQPLLDALIRSAHAAPVLLDTASDDREVLRGLIQEGLRSDMLCVTGGISMGAFDFVPEVLISLGATFHIHKMAIKPGRPSIFATMPDGTPVFALPGNPISALVGFELLVRPALAAQQGRSGVLPRLVSATLKGAISAIRDRRTFVPARASVDDRGQWVAETLSWHGSGDALGVATANALIVRPPRADRAADGATVSIMLLDRLQAR